MGCVEFVGELQRFAYYVDFDVEGEVKRLRDAKTPIDDMVKEVERHRACAKAALMQIPKTKVLGLFSVDCHTMRARVVAQARLVADRILQTIADDITGICKSLD